MKSGADHKLVCDKRMKVVDVLKVADGANIDITLFFVV